MFSLPFMRVIGPLFGVAAILAIGAYIHLTLKEAEYLNSGPATISISGVGEALAVPDIATFSFSVRAEAEDAPMAQEQSAEAVNKIVDYLTSEGIEEKDIKTEYYNLNPRYEYVQRAQTAVLCVAGSYCPPQPDVPGERVLRGYEVNQRVSVKVRDTDQAGILISGVGQNGATDVSSLQFTIDDEEAIKDEARAKAIEDAEEKAEKLADDLGVRLVRMVGYGEGGGYYPVAYARAESLDSATGVGGASSVTPALPVGENTVTINVNITYEVR